MSFATLPVFLALSSVSVLVLSVGVLYVAYIVRNRRRFSHLPSPPIKNFFLGNLASTPDQHSTLVEWTQKLGHTFVTHILHHSFIMTSDPKIVKELLFNADYKKPEFVYQKLGYLFGARVMGSGLLTNSDHSSWRKHRSLLNPFFHKLSLMKLIGVFDQYGDRLVSLLDKSCDSGCTIDMYAVFGRVTMDIIAWTAFSFDLGALANADLPFMRCVYMYFKGYYKGINDPLLQVKPNARQFVAQVRESCHTLREIATQRVKQRMDDLLAQRSVPDDTLTQLLKNALTEADPKVSDNESMEKILDEFVTLFIAGHETTASTLAFTLYELSQNGRVYAKLMEEIDSIKSEEQLDNASESLITQQTLQKHTYLTNVIKETLRMYPPAIASVRRVERDLHVGDTYLPAGSNVVINFYSLHHSSDCFTQPELFNPERFDSAAERSAYQFLPFSAGARICIGKDFAMIEAKVLLIKLLRNFKYQMRDETFEIEMAGLLRPKNGLPCVLTSRKTI